jgi:hypothetical protein
MPRTEHLVLCGGIDGRQGAHSKNLRLNLRGPLRNVRLKISDIGERVVANIPDALVDLLEVASYIHGRTARFPAVARLMSSWASDGDESCGS